MAENTRTDAAKVKELLEAGGHYDETEEPSVAPFIDMAHNLTDWLATCTTALSATTLELIERNLAAHFYVSSDQAPMSEGAGKSNNSFQGNTSFEGLRGSKFGQNAITLDHSGCLKARDQGNKLTLKWLGRDPDDQEPYASV